jgi:hypothetical protein
VATNILSTGKNACNYAVMPLSTDIFSTRESIDDGAHLIAWHEALAAYNIVPTEFIWHAVHGCPLYVAWPNGAIVYAGAALWYARRARTSRSFLLTQPVHDSMLCRQPINILFDLLGYAHDRLPE